MYDEIFTLFNFEKKYFEKEGLKSTFIGYPISLISSNEYFTNSRKNLIAFLPGSRENEIKKLNPYFQQIYNYLYNLKNHNFEIFIPTLPNIEKKIRFLTKHWKIKTIISTNPKKNETSRNYWSEICCWKFDGKTNERIFNMIVNYIENFHLSVQLQLGICGDL